MNQHPGFHIFLISLSDLQLGGPLAVVALILGNNTWLRHTGRKLTSVHLLDRLELEPGRSRQIRSHQILCQLGIWPGCRSEHGLDLLVKDRIMLIISLENLRNSKDAPALFILPDRPRQKLSVRDQSHQITHILSSSHNKVL